MTATLGSAFGVVGIVFGEAWIIAAVAFLGPTWAFAAVLLVTASGSALIAYAYDADEARGGTRPLVRRLRSWIENRRTIAEQRGATLTRVTGWLALAVLSATVGPFVTTIAAKARGGSAAYGYTAAIVSSLIFSGVWVAIYSGAIAGVKQLVGG